MTNWTYGQFQDTNHLEIYDKRQCNKEAQVELRVRRFTFVEYKYTVFCACDAYVKKNQWWTSRSLLSSLFALFGMLLLETDESSRAVLSLYLMVFRLTWERFFTFFFLLLFFLRCSCSTRNYYICKSDVWKNNVVKNFTSGVKILFFSFSKEEIKEEKEGV